MPVPPVHFGVGLLAKGLLPRWVSVTAFVVSTFVIDCEVLYYMLIRPGWPQHRWAHTFLVGGAIGAIVGTVVRLIGPRIVAAFGARWQVPDLSEAKLIPAVLGGALGGVTHALLDGVMHDDISPLRPFSDVNPLNGLASIPTLHVILVASAVLGLALLAFRWRRMVGQAIERQRSVQSTHLFPEE